MSQLRGSSQKTWTWSQVVAATGETPAALRRKLQRGQVSLQWDNERISATLWDVARLSIGRYLSESGIDVSVSFDLAVEFVAKVYRDHSFARANGPFPTIVLFRDQQCFAWEVILTEPLNPTAGLVKIGLAAADPQNRIIPIHALVVGAWLMLPSPGRDVAAWALTSSSLLSLLGMSASPPTGGGSLSHAMVLSRSAQRLRS